MKQLCNILVALLLSGNVFAADGEVGLTSTGTIEISIRILPKPIPNEITESNPTPWTKRCDMEDVICNVERSDDGTTVTIIPI